MDFVRSGDLRYLGQGYELRTAFPAGDIDEAAIDAAFAQFHELHKSDYGHNYPDTAIEIVNIRLTGIGAMPKIAAPTMNGAGRTLEAALVKTGECMFRDGAELRAFATKFYAREALPLDTPIDGPASANPGRCGSARRLHSGWRRGWRSSRGSPGRERHSRQRERSGSNGWRRLDWCS